MKKWMFVIFPGAMLAIFLVFYLSHAKEMDEREAARAAKVAHDQQEADAKKKRDEEAAHQDAVKRAEQHAKDEADKVRTRGIDNVRRKLYRAENFETTNQQASRN